MKKILLKHNWKYRQVSIQKDFEWKSASVPGNIHLDLLANGEIEDPYYRLNEQEQQWIGEVDWEYSTEFKFDDEILNKENIEIVFEGLDTYADVFLNNKLILQADNMYSGWRVNVKSHLTKGTNELRIYFHSVIKKTLPLYEKNEFIYGANNSQPEPKLSVYSRKPGYHFGWDWGPRLLTCGIWRPVYIEAFDHARLDNVRFVQKKLTEKSAELSLEIEIISFKDISSEIFLTDTDNSFEPVEKGFSVKKGINKIILDFEIKNPKRWWCNGLGEPFLYNLKLTINYGENLIGLWNEKIGLRTLELIHEKDEFGKSFYFKLNGIPVFIKGANFIPADYFIPRIKKEDYERLLNDAVDSNMNMLRLWGGAIYEENIYYELCDEKGILIWQDFMFACAMYPADDKMSERIKKEAEYNIKRLRNHPSLAFWCGNNEIDEGWHTWGWQQLYNYNEETSEKIWKEYCKIFHVILPYAVNEFDPERKYWSSSPKYSFRDKRSITDGDMHYWGVWFLNHPRENFNDYLPRFMSEYGLQSMPELKTFKQFSLPEDWNINSEVMQAHQRQYPNPEKEQSLGGYGIMMSYLKNEYHIPEDFELLAYATQILQADYLKYAMEIHRRSKPYCMGTMYWQLNDLWPVISWSTIDYYGRWKAAQYFVKKAYNSLLISFEKSDDIVSVFIVNDLVEEKEAELQIKLIDFYGNISFDKSDKILIPPNSSKKYFQPEIKSLLKNSTINSHFLFVQLKKENEILSENIFYFDYLKNLNFEEPEIDFSIEEIDEGFMIKLYSKKLAKNVKINIENSEGFLSDNYFDLIPGMEKIVLYKTENKKWDKKINFLHYYLVQNENME